MRITLTLLFGTFFVVSCLLTLFADEVLPSGKLYRCMDQKWPLEIGPWWHHLITALCVLIVSIKGRTR